MTSPFTITNDHITSCNAWISTNGPITSSNFIDCFLDVLQSFERTVSNVKAILGHIMDSGNIQACGHCGRVPALTKTVNGQKHLLCGECRDSLIFAELGPQEGYC